MATSNVSLCWSFCASLSLTVTFGDFHIPAVASQGAVDLSDQLHVVEKRIEAIEVREADLVRSAATSNLGKDGNMQTIKHAGKWGSKYQEV